MDKEIEAIFDDFDDCISTIVYMDGSKDICGSSGTEHVPAPPVASDG